LIPLHGSLHNLASRYIDKEIVVGVRPENITNRPKEGLGKPISMTVEMAEPMGGESLVHLKSGTGNLTARIRGEHLFQAEEKVAIQINLDKVTLFDPDTEEAVRYE
jgi:multiple sugar transport system ATP-binding protein